MRALQEGQRAEKAARSQEAALWAQLRTGLEAQLQGVHAAGRDVEERSAAEQARGERRRQQGELKAEHELRTALSMLAQQACQP